MRNGIVLALAVGASLFPACSRSEPVHTERVTLVWFDTSLSTKGAARAIYLEDFGRVLDSLEGGDRIVVGGIDRSITRASLLVDELIPAFNPLSDNSVEYDHQVEVLRGRTLHLVEENLKDSPARPGTDLLSALALSEPSIRCL